MNENVLLPEEFVVLGSPLLDHLKYINNDQQCSPQREQDELNEVAEGGNVQKQDGGLVY